MIPRNTLWVNVKDICPKEFINRIYKLKVGRYVKFANVVLQHSPVFPEEQTHTVDWLAPVKECLTRSGRQAWRAYTDGKHPHR